MKGIHSCLLIALAAAAVALPQGAIAASKQSRNTLLKAATQARPHGKTIGQAGTKNYNFLTVDFPGVPGTIVYDASPTKVIGEFDDNLNNNNYAGFGLKNNVYKVFTIGGIEGAEIYGINVPGEMVGQVQDTGGVWHGLLVAGGTPSSFDPPNSTYTSANDINNAGTIVGDWEDSSYNNHGFTYASGIYTSFDYPGGSNTYGYGINKNGDIVGTYEDSNYDTHGFLLHAGQYTSFDVPQAAVTYPYGINDNGVIAGYYYDSNFVGHGFVLKNGTFETVDVPRAADTYLLRVKNNGQLVGTYYDVNNEYHGFTAQ
jgi:probable HAF family extracellular repeat protein